MPQQHLQLFGALHEQKRGDKARQKLNIAAIDGRSRLCYRTKYDD